MTRKASDTAALVTTVILITSSQETGTFHFCSSIGKPSDVIDSIGRYTLIILITCPALGNIPSTNSEMKSAANSSKPIFIRAKSCLSCEEQEAADLTTGADGLKGKGGVTDF